MFTNTQTADTRPWRGRHLGPSGCVHALMRHVLGERRFMADMAVLHIVHDRFEITFVLQWLYKHRDRYAFEIVAQQSAVRRVTVWRRSRKEPSDTDT